MFCLRLRRGCTANVALTKINLDPARKFIKVKLRRFPAAQGQFLDKYVEGLVKVWVIVLDAAASWQVALHLVSRSTP